MKENTSDTNVSVVPKEYRVYFALLVTCFALWGLLNNMTDNLVPSFAKIFMIKAVDSSLVQVAFYGAYAVLALPAAFIIKKYSYRVGVLVGFGLLYDWCLWLYTGSYSPKLQSVLSFHFRIGRRPVCIGNYL